MTRILIAQADELLSAFLAKGLRSAGFTPTVCHDGERAAALATDEDFDLLLLDLGLPVRDGWAVLRSVRGAGHTLPIVVLTRERGPEVTIGVFDAGADDHLAKPFAFDELVARVRARLRGRAAGPAAPLIRVGELELDAASHRTTFRGEPVALTFREFMMLETFARHRGQVLTRHQILAHVWGHEHTAGSNVVDVYVRNLRGKLELGLIETVRGAGYRLRG